jgi:hypothetical protein
MSGRQLQLIVVLISGLIGHCNDLGHNSSRRRDPNRIDYNGDRGRDRNDCHNVRLDNGYSANGRLDRSAAYCEKWILPSSKNGMIS